MNKCAFCEHSRLKNGKLYCPWSICMLSQEDINKILRNIGKVIK